MSLLSEMLVISAGLIVGWAVVSRVISAYSRKSQEFVNGEWSDILGVSPDASLMQERVPVLAISSAVSLVEIAG